MKVILLTNVPGTGKKGQVLEVADGYALNGLFPKNLAVPANKNTLSKKIENDNLVQKKTSTKEKEIMHDFYLIHKKTIKFFAQVSEAKMLYAGINTEMIAEMLLKNFAINIDKNKILLPKPLKQLGIHEIGVKIRHDKIATIFVDIQEKPNE